MARIAETPKKVVTRLGQTFCSPVSTKRLHEIVLPVLVDQVASGNGVGQLLRGACAGTAGMPLPAEFSLRESSIGFRMT